MRATRQHARAATLRDALLSTRARPLRFLVTGGAAALTQLGLLVFWVHHGLHPIDANIVAFLLAAQMNFVLSDRFTWHDRGPALGLPTRWLFFHASIALMAVVNLTVFTVAQTAVPYLVASVLGIGVAAIGNFFSGDWLVFRTPSPTLGLRPLADDADRTA